MCRSKKKYERQRRNKSQSEFELSYKNILSDKLPGSYSFYLYVGLLADFIEAPVNNEENVINYLSLLLHSVLQSWRAPGSTQRSTQTFPSRCWTGTVVSYQRRSAITPGASAATNSSLAAWGPSPRTANYSVSFLRWSQNGAEVIMDIF